MSGYGDGAAARIPEDDTSALLAALGRRRDAANQVGNGGDARAAVDALRVAVDDFAGRVRPDEPLMLSVRADLAAWIGEAGDSAQAVRDLEPVIRDRVRVLGPEHPETLESRHDLTYFLGECGDVQAARDQSRDVLAARERVLGLEHPDTMITWHRLAYWIGEAGDPAAAAEQLRDLMPVRERVLGSEHSHTLTTAHELARRIGEAGDPAEAVRRFEQLLPVRERVLGADHPHTLTTRHELARWVGEAGDPSRAGMMLVELVPIRERVQGPRHPRTLRTRHELAVWTAEAGDTSGAVALLADLLPLRRDVLGADHPHTLETAQLLDRLSAGSQRVDDFEAAAQLLMAAAAGDASDEHDGALSIMVGARRLGFEIGTIDVAAVTTVPELAGLLRRGASKHEAQRAPRFADLWSNARGRFEGTARSPLVELADGAGAPVFFVHWGSGNVTFVRDLADGFRAGRPVYGFESTGIRERRRPALSVPETAEQYLADMLRVQPEGPYHLVGVCSGSSIAYEMACRLQDTGAVVDTLVCINSFRPGTRQLDPGWGLADLYHMRLADIEMLTDTDDLAANLPSVMGELKSNGWIDADVSVEDFYWHAAVFAANAFAQNHYDPRPFTGRVHVLQDKLMRRADEAEDWRPLAPGAVTQVIDTDSSITIMSGPEFSALLRRA